MEAPASGELGPGRRDARIRVRETVPQPAADRRPRAEMAEAGPYPEPSAAGDVPPHQQALIRARGDMHVDGPGMAGGAGDVAAGGAALRPAGTDAVNGGGRGGSGRRSASRRSASRRSASRRSASRPGSGRRSASRSDSGRCAACHQDDRRRGSEHGGKESLHAGHLLLILQRRARFANGALADRRRRPAAESVRVAGDR